MNQCLYSSFEHIWNFQEFYAPSLKEFKQTLDICSFSGRFSNAIEDMQQCLALNPGFDAAKTGLYHAQMDKQDKENRDL